MRQVLAEGLGSMLLSATVIGSGIMAERLAAGNLAVALLANTGATVAVLATLIALLGPISGAHFNPAVSLVQALRRVISWSEAGAYVRSGLVTSPIRPSPSPVRYRTPLPASRLATFPALSSRSSWAHSRQSPLPGFSNRRRLPPPEIMRESICQIVAPRAPQRSTLHIIEVHLLDLGRSVRRLSS